ncbi:MAG TPA: MBL fold metallo-hydrolase [Bryobacteraceae bacterium]|jgi:metallo-beta-lactamase family protein|nr:MBL fold metallo-hydrolase [Bryobacteraceae bacterium]
MRLTFWGAARTVTGSMHQVEVEGRKYLLDCGQYQGRRAEAEARNRNFPFPASEIDAVVLSHAHIDHSGNLPLLVRSGFHGRIFTSAGTADLCVPMLTDSGSIQERDASYLNRRNERQGRHEKTVEPMYTVADAQDTFPLFRPVPMHKPEPIGPSLLYESVDAGHMLGSTSVVLESNAGGRKIRLGFSGDVGRPGLPIIRDPEPLHGADFLIMESTYGDRLHKPVEQVAATLADVVNRTYQRGGRMIVPAFAVGRTQQIVLVLHQLINAGKIPEFPIFIDSPLAVNVTDVFRKHQELFDEEALQFDHDGEDPFGFRRLKYIREVSDSKALNGLHGPFMVISASGMCEAGRILHHLKNNIEDPRNTVLITGYQAENTLGQKIVQRRPEVNIFGVPVRLRAEVAVLDELSGHADREELLTWMKPLVPGLKRVFLVHGEAAQQQGLIHAIQERYRIEAVAPERGQSFDLAAELARSPAAKP